MLTGQSDPFYVPITLPEPDLTIDLSIIIVSWNVRDLLRDCLRSIEEGRGELSIQTIVVDGASADGSAAMVATEFPWVDLLAMDENVGFPRGNNIGLERARGRYVLLLNPDTRVLDDALPALVGYADLHPDVDALGPQVLYADGSVQPSRFRFPTFATGLFVSTWMDGVVPGVLRHYSMEDIPVDQTVEADWLLGACILVPREVVEKVGGLDEAYFMYAEELDWCRRLKNGGGRVVYGPVARVLHFVGKSSEQAVTARHINFQRAKLRYFRKYHGRLIAGLLRVHIILVFVWQLLLEATKGLLGSNRPLRRQRVNAYLEVIRSGLRPAGY